MRVLGKIFYSLPLLILACTNTYSQASQPNSGIKTPGETVIEYNRFDDLTTIRMRPFPVVETPSAELHFALVYGFKGKTQLMPDYVTLQFVSISTDWLYLNNRELILLADGERKPFGSLRRDITDRTPNGLVMESMSTEMKYITFLELLKADKIEGRLSKQEFEFKPEQLKLMRDYAIRLMPPMPLKP